MAVWGRPVRDSTVSELLLEAVRQLREHNDEYQHRTPSWLLDKLTAAAPQVEEQEVEVEALKSELAALKEPFIQLMKRLRAVDGGEDPESPITWIQARIRLRLWHQLRTLYEAMLPPVDHSWLDKLNEEEKEQP